MDPLSAVLGFLGRLLAPVVAFFLPWWAGRQSAQKAQAEDSLEAERDREKIDRDVDRLPESDLDDELSKYR